MFDFCQRENMASHDVGAIVEEANYVLQIPWLA